MRKGHRHPITGARGNLYILEATPSAYTCYHIKNPNQIARDTCCARAFVHRVTGWDKFSSCAQSYNDECHLRATNIFFALWVAFFIASRDTLMNSPNNSLKIFDRTNCRKLKNGYETSVTNKSHESFWYKTANRAIAKVLHTTDVTPSRLQWLLCRKVVLLDFESCGQRSACQPPLFLLRFNFW